MSIGRLRSCLSFSRPRSVPWVAALTATISNISQCRGAATLARCDRLIPFLTINSGLLSWIDGFTCGACTPLTIKDLDVWSKWTRSREHLMTGGCHSLHEWELGGYHTAHAMVAIFVAHWVVGAAVRACCTLVDVLPLFKSTLSWIGRH